MTVPGAGFPFPGAPGAMSGGAPANPFGAPGGMMPGGVGMAPQQPASGGNVQGFVLQIPADPTWEPMEFSDVLEFDGYYCIKITSDQAKMINDKLSVIVMGEIQDTDAVGKKVSRFMPDPRTTKGNTWFIWRGLMLSITGALDSARNGLTYQPGMFTGAIAFVKTAAYNDKEGGMKTGIDAWSTRKEWEEATAAKKHRWPARVVAPAGGGVGALPAGLPGGFPGLGGALPPPPGGAGMPTMPMQPSVTPQPMAAPMQQAAPTGGPVMSAGFPPGPMMASPGTPPIAPPAGAPVQSGFGFPPAAAGFPPGPGFAAPAPQVQQAQPPQTPQPTAAGVVAGFPGMPPQ